MSSVIVGLVPCSWRPVVTAHATSRAGTHKVAPYPAQSVSETQSALSHFTPHAEPSIQAREPEKVRERVLEHGNYSVRVVKSPLQLRKASMLIERMYSWRGYHTETAAALERNPNRIMLEASGGSYLFGTLTLGIDSEEGLLADALYESEINAFRRVGHRVCELSRFAVDPQYSSKQMLASLFQLAYLYARFDYGVTDAFIEVNPRHAAFYKRMLGFCQMGKTRTCPRVNAPAVLLHLDLDYMEAQIEQHSGSHDSTERSLYPYFATYRGELRVRDRVVQAA